MRSDIGCRGAAIFSLWALCSGCSAGALSVDELREKADSLEGQRVLVRGYVTDLVEQTLAGCRVNTCCNHASLQLFLMPTRELPPPAGIAAYFDGTFIKVYEREMYTSVCSGTECLLTCPQFDPRASAAFEFSGVLHSEPLRRSDGTSFKLLSLSQLDLPASSQLTGDGDLDDLDRAPIPPGPSTIPLR